jgi:4-hydroxybenzoate polyprenyltransferase
MTPGSLRVFASVGRLHIVAIAALGTFTSGWLFTGHHPWALSAVCAFDWFLVNLLNRVVDLPEDRQNGIVGTDFVARHRRALVGVGFGALLASFVVTALLAPALTPLRVAYHALGLAYNWPLLPGRRRIKQLYFWKNTASAVGFMLTVFGYPLAAAGWGRQALPAGIDAHTILWSAAFFFPFELSYEVIYDLRDAPGDRAAGVRSYPVVHGERGAVRVIDGLLAASMAALVVGWTTGALPWRIFIMICAPIVQVVLYKRFVRRGVTARDCVGLTWLGAGLLAAYHVWIALGLPGAGS